MKSAHAFLVSYDNGESYEDHRVEPLAITTHEGRAIALVEEIKAWIARKRENYPPSPLEVEGISDAEFMKMCDAQTRYIDRLRPPLGERCLADDVRHGNGSVNYIKLPLLPDLMASDRTSASKL